MNTPIINFVDTGVVLMWLLAIVFVTLVVWGAISYNRWALRQSIEQECDARDLEDWLDSIRRINRGEE